MKNALIATLLAVIMTLNFVDVVSDVRLGVPTWHIISEGAIVLLSAVGFFYLVIEMRSRSRSLHQLSYQLQRSNAALADMNDEMAQAKRAFSDAIQEQFGRWELTQGERDVAMLLLKGLSFREIANLRDTREKTVRQQASTVYAKSGLEGRHAFSAWFLEDALDPGRQVSDRLEFRRAG
jgi:DNA-binding CsgD family transcriptional regulator